MKRLCIAREKKNVDKRREREREREREKGGRVHAIADDMIHKRRIVHASASIITAVVRDSD